MSSLEKAVQPIIVPMIFGHRHAISLREQLVIATWAVKTGMVLDSSKPEQRYFTQDERGGLMRELVPAPLLGARVWATRYLGENRSVNAIMASLISSGSVVAHMSTFAIGQFALQVLVERRSAGYTIRVPTRSGPWNQLLLPIWPPSPVADIERSGPVWPPKIGIVDEKRFEELFERFSALSS
jgi:hypothetical protein